MRRAESRMAPKQGYAFMLICFSLLVYELGQPFGGVVHVIVLSLSFLLFLG
jgi:hypothetical protein